jgi:hypothetical protein
MITESVMTESTSRAKSCDPQLLAELPQKDWDMERLGLYAQAQHQAIETSEQSLSADYWRLGLALNLARDQFAHHQWEKSLQKLGIDKTRASKARAIHRTFPTEQAVDGLSVQEAYARRERRPRKAASKKQRKKRKQKGLCDWLRDVCREVDFFFDEAKFADPNESSALLPAVDAAIKELMKLRERLQERSCA